MDPTPLTFTNGVTKPSVRVRLIWALIDYSGQGVISTPQTPVNLKPGESATIYSLPHCVKQARCFATLYDGDALIGTVPQDSPRAQKCHSSINYNVEGDGTAGARVLFANRPPDKTPVDILGFSSRTLNSLKNGGVTTVQDLTDLTPSEVADIHGIGEATMVEVLEAAQLHGLRFRV
jgi:hypothetical protein